MGLFGSKIEKLERNRDVDGLVGLLGDKNDATRDQAAQALARLNVRRATDSLRDNLDKVGLGACLEISKVMAGRNDPRAAEPLIAISKNQGASAYHLRAGLQLVALKDGRATEILIACLKGGLKLDERVKVTSALERLGDSSAIGPLKAALDEGLIPEPDPVIRVLAKLGDSWAVDQISARLLDRSRSEQTRSFDVALLRELGSPRAIDGLIGFLDRAVGRPGAARRDPDEPEGMCEKVSEALGQLGDRRAADALMRFAEEFPRPWAWIALSELGDPRAIKPLTRLVDHASGVRAIAEAENRRAGTKWATGPDRIERLAVEALKRLGVVAMAFFVRLPRKQNAPFRLDKDEIRARLSKVGPTMEWLLKGHEKDYLEFRVGGYDGDQFVEEIKQALEGLQLPAGSHVLKGDPLSAEGLYGRVDL